MEVEGQQPEQYATGTGQESYPLISRLKNSNQPMLLIDQEDCDKGYYITLDRDSERNLDRTSITQYVDNDCTDLQGPDVTEVIYVKEGIDQGGYGAVYKARYDGGKTAIEDICIKTAAKKFGYDGNGGEQLKRTNESLIREANILRQLREDSHDNIISFLFCCTSFGSDNLEVFIGLEYFTGKNLSSTIETYVQEKKPFPTKTLHQIMRCSTAAVQHLQKLNIVHCDIKPHNILFNNVSEKLKFIDFGSAFNMSELENCSDGREMSCCGAATPEYMAPEILLANYTHGKPNSDIYSLGLLMYRIITLQRPWHHIDQISEARKNKQKDLVWKLIKDQYVERDRSGMTQTALQERIVNQSEDYYVNNSEECQLVKEMLSIAPSGRPSCSDINATMDICCSKLARSMSRLSTESRSSLEQSTSFSSTTGDCSLIGDASIPTTVIAMFSNSENSTSISPSLRKTDSALMGQRSQPAVENIEKTGEVTDSEDYPPHFYQEDADEEEQLGERDGQDIQSENDGEQPVEMDQSDT